MAEKFKKVIEDFMCLNCDQKIIGNGYTNHCPRCLYSLHVDIYPGDRANGCFGLMKPITLIKKGEEFIITHQCLRCGEEKNNKTNPVDDVSGYLKNMLE